MVFVRMYLLRGQDMTKEEAYLEEKHLQEGEE